VSAVGGETAQIVPDRLYRRSLAGLLRLPERTKSGRLVGAARVIALTTERQPGRGRRLLVFLQTGGVFDVRADFLFDGVGRLLVVWRAASAGIWVALAAWWVEPTSSS
jgi:hypothetical protein